MAPSAAGIRRCWLANAMTRSVTTYGAVADALSRTVLVRGPRTVGRVMSLHGGGVPWWRVVRADGSLPPSHGEEARAALDTLDVWDGRLAELGARIVAGRVALLAELRTERLRAAIDVVDPEPLPADHPLWSAPHLLITPHVAGGTTAMLPRMAALVRTQVERMVAGEPLLHVVHRG